MAQFDWVWGAALVGCFAALALWEAATPSLGHPNAATTERRLLTNFTLGIGTIVLAGVLPVSTIAAAVMAERWRIGLGQQVAVLWIVSFVLLMLVRSFATYWVHRASHVVPAIWRVHRVHHADSAVDVSTGLRNHPLELVIVVPVAAAVVLLLGPPVSAVLAADTLLFAAGLWQHADVALPPFVQRMLDQAIVTPAFHRTHHAPDRAAHDRNYGDVLVLWDRLFGTAAPLAPRDAAVGLDRPHPDRLLTQLTDPLRR